jgi:fructokinase
MLNYVGRHGMDCSGIQMDESRETGKVRVSLDEKGIPDYYIYPDMAYDHIDYDKLAIQSKPVDLLYFGTLIQRSESGHQRLDAYLKSMKGKAKLFCDLNLRLGCHTPRSILGSLNHADILKLNDAELSEIGSILGRQEAEDQLVAKLQKQFQIEVVALTKGEQGSVLYMAGQAHRLSETSILRHGPLIDTVGAGDAYAAMLAFGILQKWAPQKILYEATALASYICTVKGAIPDSAEIYRKYHTENK